MTPQATNDDNDWQQVRRRKRPFPANWRHSQQPQLRTNLYQPYSRPSYAQVLRQPPPPPSNMTNLRVTPPTTQPSSPTSPNTTIYYVSPHSPSRLRFPPSHTFSEWKGRCFRCCRTGHAAAKCRNPKRCGRCWAFGHIGSKCKQEIVAPPLPLRPILTSTTTRRSEPTFEELLTGSYPYTSPEMPKERPLRLHCFIERDDEYYKEIDRLKQGVVMHTAGFQWELSVDNVADYACRTKLIQREEIQVTELSGSRFLIILPEGLDPDTFINATPQEVWDEGLSFQPWSPLENAEISVPAYKILLQLVGVPPHLWRDKHIANVVSRFGIYLGSVAPENPASIASYIVAVGVDDLTLVPPQLAMHDGGLIHTIQVNTLSWHRGPIYSADEMPKHPKSYLRPQPPPPSSSSSDADTHHNDLELIPMSSQVLREMCRGRTADSLPPELRRFASLEEIDMEFPCMTTQEVATSDQPLQNQIPQMAHKESEHSDDRDKIVSKNDVASSPLQTTAPHHRTNPKSRHFGSREFHSPNKASAIHNTADQNQNHKASRTVPFSNLPLKQVPNKQPQKILKRGDILPPVRINSEGVGSVQNQRFSLSKNKDISKAATNGHTGENPVNIKNDLGAIRGVTGGNSKTDPPPILEQAEREHVTKGNQASLLFQSKNKGPSTALRSGPYATKYKWIRPSKQIPANNAQITKKVIISSSHKRKNTQVPVVGPVKKTANKGKGKVNADVSFNPEGFSEVRVDYEHVSKLASGCGFNNSDIEGVIHADNTERQVHAQAQATSSRMEMEDEDPELERFELDPRDELSSDEEAD